MRSMQSASLPACIISWVAMMILDLPSFFIFKIISSTISVFSLSMDAVGSSRKSISGSMAIALAMPSLWVSPLESVSAL